MAEKKYQRLSDRILEAMNLALDQKDVAIADLLRRALEMTLKRNASSRSQIDRRSAVEEITKAIAKLEALKKTVKGD